ncbi:MAG: class I SAM-dependent methyltransferase, partial [Candidatus Omnitrophica bacterium]|nr:class I SAM-dependent methyltransferase [Candidatus Omnitrophota bacterium]
NAAKEKVEIDFRIADFMELELSGEKFDYCLLSCCMYSAIPGDNLRIEELLRIKNYLNEGGLAAIHFLLETERKEHLLKLRKFAAKLFKGNTGYTTGDDFSSALHFLHYFSDEQEPVAEAEKAGFIVKEIGNDSSSARYAILGKPSR